MIAENSTLTINPVLANMMAMSASTPPSNAARPWRSGRPRCLGHEIAGVIERVGSDADPAIVGRRVAVYPWIGCGTCVACRGGEEKAGPDDRMATDEQQIAGIEHTIGRHVHQHVAAGVSGAEMRQDQALITNLNLHRLVEQSRRRGADDTVPVEAAAHDLVEEGAALAEIFPTSL
jgi:Alcohol dehydrogenase GroES-like domain